MSLRHAVLAALLSGEYSGYQLTKAFDVGVANFWYARPQQLYSELSKLEDGGLISGRDVVQQARPTKRLFTVTDAGLAELARFAADVGKPSFIRDDLLVKVQAVDHVDAAPVIAQLDQRAAAAAAKVEILDKLLLRFRGDLDEEAYLRHGTPIGPYLTCLRGKRFEQEHHDWSVRAAALLRDRAARNHSAPTPDQAR
ncbi:PadR family transcriptional regulator [Umezawaea sp. Da 62-37]|uniref:PadR family transcriptional regulator n=1 Tax=Umezawaea sp. Da 62-37 TaxID=3075927 RepID=UPI0028F706BC|nr:PadR family transcriptional regulator [Umezawaea sp. Da 62-37]WNV87496.1 PadR family transcriptional regulator [Umezawaea sp. Da 62-37]